jgi:hypothetical protein
LSIKYDPTDLLRKIAPKKKLDNLLKVDVKLKKTALSFVDDIDFIDKKRVSSTALKVIKGYKKRIKADRDQKNIIKDDPKLLIQRVKNEIVLQISEQIKENYHGESYIWLPSSAEEPDPEHQLNYGKKFIVGDGEMPGERYGCQCGMEILVNENRLEL